MVWSGDSGELVAAVHDVYDALGALVDLMVDGGFEGLEDIVDDVVMEEEEDSIPEKVKKQL